MSESIYIDSSSSEDEILAHKKKIVRRKGPGLARQKERQNRSLYNKFNKALDDIGKEMDYLKCLINEKKKINI